MIRGEEVYDDGLPLSVQALVRVGSLLSSDDQYTRVREQGKAPSMHRPFIGPRPSPSEGRIVH